MKFIFLKQIVFPFTFGVGLMLFLPIFGCNTEGGKLTREDRIMIDTISSRQIVQVSVELDKWFKDSSEILVKKGVDSLMVLRQQEIINETISTMPPHWDFRFLDVRF